MAATAGSIVMYVLNGADADAINSRANERYEGLNHASAGQEYPALIVRSWSPSMANLQVFYDGAGAIWATSRAEGVGQGMWHTI